MTVAKRKPRTVESLNLLWGAAIALTLFSVSFFLSWAEFRALYDSDRIYFAVSTGLALVTFALFCAYVIATHTEIILLNQYLGEEAIPRVKPKVYLITFGLAILFGALIALSRNLLTYSAVMVGYNLFDLWGNWEVARQIGPPIEKKLQSRLDGGGEARITDPARLLLSESYDSESRNYHVRKLDRSMSCSITLLHQRHILSESWLRTAAGEHSCR